MPPSLPRRSGRPHIAVSGSARDPAAGTGSVTSCHGNGARAATRPARPQPPHVLPTPRLRAWAWAVLAAILPATILPADAARFWRWRGEDGVTHYGDRPPADAAHRQAAESFRYHRQSGPPVQLRLVDRGSHHEVHAGNRLPGPVQVELRLRQGDNVTGVPAMPVRTTLAAASETVVARLYVLDPRRGSTFDVVLEQMPGDPEARPLDHEYRLPFEYGRVRVDQGFGGRFSHDDVQNRHAVDFAVPEGTPVLAAREGIVLQVESDFAGTGLDRERYGGRANYVRILHADGSMALYAHLKPEGVLVRVGQRVRQGQQVALSGNTGFSTAPHLHFVVQVNRGMHLESVPFRMFGTLGELDFSHTGTTPAR